MSTTSLGHSEHDELYCYEDSNKVSIEVSYDPEDKMVDMCIFDRIDLCNISLHIDEWERLVNHINERS